MRKVPIRKTAAFALCLASVVRAETIGFESAAYTTDKTLVGADGWVLSATDVQTAQEDFRIQAGAAGQGRWAHVQTAGTASVYRPLGNATGNAGALDVRWRWRGNGDSSHFCVGISGGSGSVRQSNRALACLEPFGALSAQGTASLPFVSTETWRKGAWQYVRMTLDASAGTTGRFTLYVSDDSLRATERVAFASVPMGGSGSLARLVLREEAATGSIDLDDFSWEAVAAWQPVSDADTAWSTGKNWSTGSPPDSNTRVLFPEGEAHGCLLDRNATVMSVTVASGFPANFNLGAQTLSVLDNADFTGGAVATGAGKIRFPGTRSSSLIGPVGNRPLPALRHDGSGLLRLDGRALSVGDLTLSGGSLDFNGFDLIVIGAWQVLSGRPGTLRNLDGRSVIVTRGARLEGAGPDTLLGLATSPKGWTLNASGTDSLTARYALLGNARSAGNAGYAYRSTDAGGNGGWIFFNVPAFAAQPHDTTLRPGETASFRVSLVSAAGATFQWLRNDVNIPGAQDSVYTLTGLRAADSGAVFTCKATNPAGYAFSRAATLRVVFPKDSLPNLIPPGIQPGSAAFADSILLSLSPPQAGARLFYTLDGSVPDSLSRPYQGPFILKATTTVRAIAYLDGYRPSPVTAETYTLVPDIAAGKRTLAPGQRLALSGDYSLSSPYKGASSVDVDIVAADSVAAAIHGFRDILFGIRLSLPEGASAFPKVSFNAPSGEPRALFRLSPPGVVRWISSADTSTLDAQGIYFLAIDTAAPVLRYAGETFTSNDSTRVVVTIEDNVQNLALDLERSDDTAAGFTGREVNPVMVLAVNAKNAPGSLRPLTLKLRVSDHTRTTAFPADGSAYPMAQKLSAGARSPAAFHIGDDPKFPWDLIAVPLAAEKPLTLSQLRKANAAPGLSGSALDSATGKYRFLSDDEPLAAGTSFWLAAPLSLPSLVLPALQTATRHGAPAWKLTLHPGWNHVADPDLTPLWWPATRANPEAYQASPVKGLHAWDAAAGAYVHAEVLEPWRGYFAYFYGERDTVIQLLDAPASSPSSETATASPTGKAAKRTTAAGIGLRLSWPGGPDLRLGASEGAADGFGPEDEARPPAIDPAGTRLFSDRGGARLETDIAHWRPGAVYAWKVVAGLSSRAPSPASREGNPDAMGSLSAGADFLPPGYAAWAVSASRGLRFPVTADGVAALPWHPGYADTLEVLAGPAAALETRLADVPLRAGPFAARALPYPGGYLLRLDLPAAARVRVTLCSLDGRALEDRILDLPAGRYRLPQTGRIAPGIYALRILTAGAGAGSGIPLLTALKLAIP